MELPERYIYKYEKSKLRYGKDLWQHMWSIVGGKGGCHLMIQEYENSQGIKEYSCGLEYHYIAPPEYMKDKAPSHMECFLIKRPCWHDGTSTYATENYLPMFLGKRSDAEIFYNIAKDLDQSLGEE